MDIRNIFCKKLYLLFCLSSFLSLSSCAEKTIDNAALSGPWLMSIFTDAVGKVQTVMYFEVNADSSGVYPFHAFTEKNMDRKIFGFWRAEAGRMIGSSLKQGSIVRIVKGKFSGDSLSGILTTPFGNFYIHTTVRNGQMSGNLTNGKNNIIGHIKGSKGLPALPLRNYPAIMDSAIAVTQNKLYDPSILHTPAWEKFKNEMARVSKFTEDDAAFVLAFFYFSQKMLPFTHYSLYAPLDQEEDNSLSTDKNVTLEQKGPKTMYMKVSSFGGSEGEMDTAFSQIMDKGYDTLIVDLRDNGGGSIEAGLGFIRHLIKDTLYGGIFLTQKYFINHTLPPGADQYKSFPAFSKANLSLLYKGISELPGICLVAYPQPPVYTGKVYLLVNGNTASTCEPIVYGLKQHHIATIAGERTAGAMLCGEQYDIKDGFTLTVPVATYYASDGYKIDKRGVEPDIKVKSADALDSVLQHGAKQGIQ